MKLIDWYRQFTKRGAVHRNPAGVVRPRKPRLPKDDKVRPPRPVHGKWVPPFLRFDHWKKEWVVVKGHWIKLKRNFRAALDIVTPTRPIAKPRHQSLLLLDAEQIIEEAFKKPKNTDDK